MDETTERRIEEARAEAERQKQTKEFLESLKSGDELLKHVYNPEAWVMRDKAASAAKRGEIARPDCAHDTQPLQYQDDDPVIARRGNNVNLFVCRRCGALMWFVDAWGTPAADE